MNSKLQLTQQQLQADYEKVKSEESEKSNKLQELMSVISLNKRNLTNNDLYDDDMMFDAMLLAEKRSLVLPDNRSLSCLEASVVSPKKLRLSPPAPASPVYIRRPKADTWADFLPYKDELSAPALNEDAKTRKQALNEYAKLVH